MNRNNIYIGADSKVSNTEYLVMNGKMLSRKSESNKCKIYRFGNIIFTGTGPRIKFLSSVFNNIRNNGDFGDLVATFVTKSRIILTDTLNKIKDHDPQQIKEEYKDTFTAIIICTFENNQPKAYRLEYSKKIDKSGALTVNVIKHNEELYNDYDQIVLRLGHFECVPTNFNMMLNSYFGNYKETINEMITKQISCTPNYVGFPISIIQMTNSGINILQPGLCNLKN